MLPTNIDEFLSNISEDTIQKSPGGMSSCFVAFNDKIGVKLYMSKKARDNCHRRQTHFSKMGYAPDTYGVVYLKNQKHFKYGYITERVKIVDNVLSPTLPPHPAFNGTDCNGLEFYNNRDSNFYDCKSKERLLKALNDGGFYYHDYGRRNVGLKNGQFVCVDFGDESGQEWVDGLQLVEV